MRPASRPSRRTALATALFAGGAAAAEARQLAQPTKASPAPAAQMIGSTALGLDGSSPSDQTAAFQTAIDQTSAKGQGLALAPGRYVVSGLVLRSGTWITGAPGASVLVYGGRGSFVTGKDLQRVRLDGLTFDGGFLPLTAKPRAALIALDGVKKLHIENAHVRQSTANGLLIERTSGRVTGSSFQHMTAAALMSLDATGLAIDHNTISDCRDNGILVWRSTHGEDGTRVSNNRIARITNVSGGTGQYGNGINIYRAGSVQASGNRITDCAYTGIRANEASNVQMVGNHIERCGEVALYAEAADERVGAAGYEGALISNNVIDTAAAGISVTNFNNGGRLAVVQGNLIRNLFQREQEPQDKRGEGIGIEADAVISNNVIENAPTCGIMIGWGHYMRNVVATGNMISNARIGIAVSGDSRAGQCLITQNMFVRARDGAIRAMDHATPVGADLATGKAPRHITVTGNVVA